MLRGRRTVVEVNAFLQLAVVHAMLRCACSAPFGAFLPSCDVLVLHLALATGCLLPHCWHIAFPHEAQPVVPVVPVVVNRHYHYSAHKCQWRTHVLQLTLSTAQQRGTQLVACRELMQPRVCGFVRCWPLISGL